MTALSRSHVIDALDAVRSRISRVCAASGREKQNVTILAVTKGFGPEAIEAAIAAGLVDIGENYYQEAAEKFARGVWRPGMRRHFIGRVQRNKARRIAALFDVVQTVEDRKTAQALNDGAAAEGKELDVLVQVNAAGDQRQGVRPEALADFISLLADYRNLRVRGLMAMGPRDPAETPVTFARAASCFDKLRVTSLAFDTLSMGMSDDLELAVAAGSTMLRLGTALFGSRPPKAAVGTERPARA